MGSELVGMVVELTDNHTLYSEMANPQKGCQVVSPFLGINRMITPNGLVHSV